MKNILKTLFALLFVALSICSFVPVVNMQALALNNITDGEIRSTVQEYLLSFVEYNGVARKSVIRTAGSQGEHITAGYISAYLEDLGLEAKTNEQDSSIMKDLDGFQKFNFYDMYTGDKETSYNVVYTIKGASSHKKVVLSCNYDNDYVGYLEHDDFVVTQGEDFSDGINASAGSVAVLLTLAEILPQSYFDFDIELVFFGAGYNNNAGARFYNQTMNSKEREKVLLMLDISRIALGEKVYYYSGAFGSNADEFYNSTLTLEKFTHGLSGTATEDDNNMLGYSNAGYSSSTAVFEGTGLNVLHIFAGTYDQGVFGGFCEYAGLSNITNTQNDSVDYIREHYDHDLTDNMTIAIKGVIALVNNENFASTLSNKPSTWQYKIFSANNYVSLIMLVMLIVLMLISVIVHYKISKKTFKYIADNKISGVMIQIDEDKTSDKKE